MRNGTQEELDAAREDMRLIPNDVVFQTVQHGKFPDGTKVVRGCAGIADHCGDEFIIGFQYLDESDYWYVDHSQLEVIHD